MATLQDLIASLPGAMQQQILSPEQQQSRLQDYLNAANPEILRRYGQTSQQQNEAAFGKGMGLSTWNAYQQALNTLNQNEALNKARVEGQNAIDAAQRAAIGNASSYTSGESSRQQQAQQFRASQRQASNLQNRGMLYQGLGGLAAGGIGTAARDLTRPAGTPSTLGNAYDRAKEGISGLFGGGPPTEQTPDLSNPQELNAVSGLAGSLVPQPEYNPPDLSSLGGDYGASNMSAMDFSPYVQQPDFSLDGFLNSLFA